jgi:hypothetical protein
MCAYRLAAFAGVAVAYGLTGCGGGGGSSAVSTVTATTEVTVNAPPAESWTMPNETGKTLQAAQDDLQALTGNPGFISTSEDLTGQGRQQIMDRNWQVCSSTPAPGSSFTAQTNVVFGVVRDTETCP